MSNQRDFVFIMHGARSEQPDIRDLITRVRDEGHAVEPRITWSAGDATTFAREGAERGADVIVALGGDGTVNEVINGLEGFDIPVGIIPVGTANDFARQTGIPLDVDHAMDVILAGEPVRVDTAELNGKRYLNVSTGGVGAEATAETPVEAKEALGLFAYAITGVRKLAGLEPRAARFEGPGFDLSLEFLIFAVGNGRVTGGGTLITPRARATDGLLDLCIIEGMPVGEFARMMFRIKRGEHLEDDGVRYLQTPEVVITSDSAISVNVDGEPSDGRRLAYRVRPGDLRAYLPRLPGDPEPEE
ncbi:MAG: diacylglycerol/lipid kinase family protein [Gemmatimonadaceae bacterium]